MNLKTKSLYMSIIFIAFNACVKKINSTSQNLQTSPISNKCNGNLIQTTIDSKVSCNNLTISKINTNITEAEISRIQKSTLTCPEGLQTLAQLEPRYEKGYYILTCGKKEKIFETTARECKHKEHAYDLSSDGLSYNINCACKGILQAFNSKSTLDKTIKKATPNTNLELTRHKYAKCLLAGNKYTSEKPKVNLFKNIFNLFSSDEDLKTNSFEKQALFEGRVSDYYGSRINRGEHYGKLAEGVVNNSTIMGGVANSWLKVQVNLLEEDKKEQLLNGKSWDEFSSKVNVDLANEHAKAVDSDTQGTPGLLSSDQISEYHENYFTSLGLPANTFGGSALGFRTEYWCQGCDKTTVVDESDDSDELDELDESYYSEVSSTSSTSSTANTASTSESETPPQNVTSENSDEKYDFPEFLNF